MESESSTENKSDKIEYPLNQIYFYLTESCNLRCRHCYLAPKHQAPDQPVTALDPGLFKTIIVQAKTLGLSGVKLTGGEPLLHPQIHEILEVIHTQGLRLAVETNGVLCTPELAARLKATSKNPFVSVSLDGADAETHEWVRGVEGSFEGALAGIRNLVKAGFRPQVIMSVMRRNKDQLKSVVRLAERLGAGSVKFNLVQPLSRGEKMHEAGQALKVEELVDIGDWVETVLSNSSHLKLFYSHPAAFRPLGKMFGENGVGCGRCGIFGILGVLSSGAYALCGIGEVVPDLVFGHAAKDSLAKVWMQNGVLNEIREGLPGELEGVCADCLMIGVCLGNCIAHNYYSKNSLWAPYWYCQEAKDRGVFPENRLNPKRQSNLN
jgi:SynChlorMet cassette radical SAM/SPASM protein ScmF